jgi:Icc-related predicted phosphoesterase
MKILAFTDIHGDHDQLTNLKRKAEHADITICAGDITNYGHDLTSMINDLNSFPTPVYTIHGNHDGKQELTNLCLTHNNVTMLHKQLIDTETHHLIGYGGEGFSFTTDDFESFIKHTDLPNDNIILITHQPPHNTELDKQNAQHTGNNSFRKFIDAHPVTLSISGHMHENFGVDDHINTTHCINPGPTGILLTV